MMVETHSCGGFRFCFHSASDLGRVRSNNEDQRIESPQLGLFGVCDGLGGHAAGEVASTLASQTITREVGLGSGTAPEILRASIEAANQKILEEQSLNPERRGMGTTVSAVWVSGSHGQVWALHLGDSRIYRMRSRKISQETEDHSPVFRLYQQGDLTKDQILQHPQKNLLERSLGISSTISPDVFQLDIQLEDRLLMCTDGLSDSLRDSEIEALLQEPSLEVSVTRLIAEANRRGGHDNITICLIEFVGVPD